MLPELDDSPAGDHHREQSRQRRRRFRATPQPRRAVRREQRQERQEGQKVMRRKKIQRRRHGQERRQRKQTEREQKRARQTIFAARDRAGAALASILAVIDSSLAQLPAAIRMNVLSELYNALAGRLARG